MKIKSIFLILILAVAASSGDNISKKLDQLCASLVDSLPAPVKSARVVIIPFEDKTGNESYSLGISEYLIVALQKEKVFSLADRTEFKKVVAEIRLSRSDYADENSTIEIGKVLAAEYILTGSIFKSFGNYSIVAKLIKTETTEIVSSATVTVIPSRLDSFTKDLFSEKNRVTSSLFRSVLLPGWGQFYSDQNVRGTISLVACLAALGTEIGLIVSSYKAFVKREDYYLFGISQEYDQMLKDLEITKEEYEANYEAYKEDYSEKHERAVIGGAITGAVWVLNLIDAAIAGTQSKKKFKLYFSSNFKNKIGIKCAYKF